MFFVFIEWTLQDKIQGCVLSQLAVIVVGTEEPIFFWSNFLDVIFNTLGGTIVL